MYDTSFHKGLSYCERYRRLYRWDDYGKNISSFYTERVRVWVFNLHVMKISLITYTNITACFTEISNGGNLINALSSLRPKPNFMRQLVILNGTNERVEIFSPATRYEGVNHITKWTIIVWKLTDIVYSFLFRIIYLKVSIQSKEFFFLLLSPRSFRRLINLLHIVNLGMRDRNHLYSKEFISKIQCKTMKMIIKIES